MHPPDLIIAATTKELGDALAGLDRARTASLVCGIGVVDAAANLGSYLARHGHDVRRVLFIGTAGTLGSDLAIGDLVFVAEAHLVEGYPSLDSYLPEPLVAMVRAGVHLRGLEGVTACTRVGVTRVAPTSVSPPAVENMEVFGVLRACQLAGVAAGAVLAISNQVGPAAHSQWLAHGREVMARLWARLPDLLREATPGAPPLPQ